MPISIGSNISSLRAQRRLASNAERLSATFARLSSGLRINKASDDPAGLAVASSLYADSRVYTQGIRNLNDGISCRAIANGAIENLKTVLSRAKELAEQSANGVYSDT